MTFRELRADDVPELRALDRIAFSDRDQFDDELYSELPHAAEYRTTVAVDESGRVLGYVFVDLGSEPVNVRSLAVRSDARRHGCGESLMRRAIAQTSGPLALYVDEDNVGARRLYERLGFAVATLPEAVPWKIGMILNRP